jgi:sugar phosphate isomerase/epimerase
LKLALQTYSLHLAFGKHPDCQHFPVKITLPECFKKAKKWGFAGVQIDPMHLEGLDENYARQIKQIADEEGLFLELGVQGFEASHLKIQLQLAQWLNVHFIRVFDTVRPRPKEIEKVNQQLDFIKREIKKIIPDIEAENIVLGWENHADYSTAEQLRILKQIDHPNFRACIDIGNSMMFLEPPLETVTKLAPFAGGVHFKDYAVTGTTYGLKFYGTALGKGVIPLKEIVSILKQKTDLHHLVYEQSIEPISNDYREAISHEQETLIQSLKFVRNQLGLEIV